MSTRTLDTVALGLLLATALTWWLGEGGVVQHTRWAVPLVLLMAGAKGAAVAWHFMELRHAPLLWRALVLGWLGLVLGLIGLAWMAG